jgi:hypothetical protein
MISNKKQKVDKLEAAKEIKRKLKCSGTEAVDAVEQILKALNTKTHPALYYNSISNKFWICRFHGMEKGHTHLVYLGRF